MIVRDAMSKDPITVSPNDSISKIARIFNSHQIWSVFVVQSEKLVGIVTKNDLNNRTSIYSSSESVSEIMSKRVHTIHPDADIEEAKSKIYRLKINGLAVVSRGKLCGIITRHDIRIHSEENSDGSILPIKSYSVIPNKTPVVPQKQSDERGTLIGSIFAVILLIIFASFISNMLLSFILLGIHPNMQLVFGNPKPLYFYDIAATCNSYNIDPGIQHFSTLTGVKFVRLPYPLALFSGGISYDCGQVSYQNSMQGAVGESESGMVGASFIIITWNKISLIGTNEETIFHETLHSMSFAHSQNPSSIMYPTRRGYSQIDPDIIDFIRTVYIYDPFAYLNIITLNEIIVVFILLYLSSKIRR